jgi:hypothetical protein
MISAVFDFCTKHFIRLFTVMLILTYLRIPLAAGTGIYSLRRTLIIFPILVSLFLIGVALRQRRRLQTSFLTRIWLVNLLLAGAYCVYATQTLGFSMIYDFLPTLGPVLLAFFPILALEQFEIDPKDLLPVFEKVSLVVIWIGFFWFALQGFSNIEADRLSTMLVPLNVQMETYPDSTVFSHRRVGFLLRMEPSALAVMVGAVYIYGLLLTQLGLSRARRILYSVSVIVGLWAILYSTSLTLMLASVGIMVFMTFYLLRRNRMKILGGSFIAFALILLLFKNTICSFLPRIIYYIEHSEKYLNKFYVDLNCSLPAFFMRFEPKESLANKCVANEMLFFNSLSSYGLLNVITWYVFTGLCLYLFVWSIWKKKYHLVPLSAAAAAFLTPALHMSGVENWGNNYLYLLAIYCLYRMKRQMEGVS